MSDLHGLKSISGQLLSLDPSLTRSHRVTRESAIDRTRYVSQDVTSL